MLKTDGNFLKAPFLKLFNHIQTSPFYSILWKTDILHPIHKGDKKVIKMIFVELLFLAALENHLLNFSRTGFNHIVIKEVSLTKSRGVEKIVPGPKTILWS